MAVTLATLSALGELHRAGKVHGGVSEDSVGVASDGWVRLAAAAAGDERRGPGGDLQDTGRLLCRLLGSPLEERPALPSSAAERTVPALVAVARALARERTSLSADGAWTAVREAAGYWGSEPQLVRALATLAERVDRSTPIERAVTRVLAAPPPAPEPLPSARLAAERLRPVVRVPELRLPRPRLSELSLPRPTRLGRLGRRRLGLLALALAVGLLIGGFAGARQALRSAPAAAAAPAAKARSGSAPARPAGLYAQTPSAAVSTFFQLVREQRLPEAALLWKPKMASAVDLNARFAGIRAIDLRRDDTIAEDDRLGIATVEVDWVETRADGSSHEFIGEIYTDTGPVLWRWDSWRVHEVAPESG